MCAKASVDSHHAHTPRNIQEEIHLVEEEIPQERQVNRDLEFMTDIASWVPDTNKSQGFQNPYLHIMDFY